MWLFSAGPQIQGVANSPQTKLEENSDSNAPFTPKGLSGSMLAQKRAKKEKSELKLPVVTEIAATEGDEMTEDLYRPLGGKSMFSGINWQVCSFS